MTIRSKHKFVVAACTMLALTMTESVHAEDFPNKPIEWICIAAPGSGGSLFAQMLAKELSKPELLGVPINIQYKTGGSNNEPLVYTYDQPADGYTLVQLSASFAGFFNLPHFTHKFEDFDILYKVENTLFGIAVRSDSPFKTFQDVIDYAKKNPGKLSMGSNKVGSVHHRNHVALMNAAGIDIGFIPYQGTGHVVKDVLGGHLAIGMAQPGLWDQHIKSGKVRPLLLLDDTRLDKPNWSNVPTPKEIGIGYEIPHMWEGVGVKKGTPKERMKILQAAFDKIRDSQAYQEYLARSPQTTPAFSGDTQALNREMAQAIKDARAFMIKMKIIEN